MADRILDLIQDPSHLKLLTDEELTILASEIRKEILTVTSKNGGHVASSLGAVEIILAVHSLINSPYDHFLFDVGHQSYAHMLVTGRLNQFNSLRQYKGLSGFPKPQTNIHDVYPSGHASDSLSIACGLAKARDLNHSDEKIVALIGDASIAGGMAFEALNDIGQAHTPLVIILNDNEMSISRNVGALAKHFGDVRMSSHYRNSRNSLQDFMENQMSIAGKMMLKISRSAKDTFKQFLMPESTIFEKLGIICTPPVDGHNISLLKHIIKSALDADAPVLVHAITKKGAGYLPAENNPSLFHGIGPFNIKSGKLITSKTNRLTFTQVFSKSLLNEMKKDENIVAIAAAMIDGTGLRPIVNVFPERVFDVGIAEAHAIGVASGLALGNKKPVVTLYSTFFQRAVDQAIIDVALANSNVVIALDRAGLVGNDGPTHHGVFDISLMKSIPNIKILTPSNGYELSCALHTALSINGPVILRYPKDFTYGDSVIDDPITLVEGKSKIVRKGNDITILAFGRMVSNALSAAQNLSNKGIEACVIDMRWAKPLDVKAIKQAAKTKLIVTIEDGIKIGGIGEQIAALISTMDLDVPIKNFAIPDIFIEHGKTELLFKDLQLDANGLTEGIIKKLNSLK